MNDLPILLDEYKISRWAYLYCKDIKDDPEIREYIIESEWAYYYCGNIDDNPEIRKFIIKSEFAYLYCKYINTNDERLINLSEKYKGIYKI